MKLCLIVDDYLPESIKVAAKMMHELGVEFVRQGHQVTIIAPSSLIASNMEISSLDGITVCRFKSGKIKNVSKSKRALNESLLSFNAWKAIKTYAQQNPHDLIAYYSPTIFWGILVKKLKKLWGVPAYLILRDFFPQWAIDNGILRKHSIPSYYFKHIEKINYKAADIIALQSPNNLDWFSANFKTGKPLDILYIWASSIIRNKATGKYRKTFNLEEKVVFFYGGNIGHSQDMMNIVRLAVNLKKEKTAHILLVGKGDEVELIKKNIQTHQLDNLTILPAVSQEEYASMLAEFDVGLFSLHREHKTHNFPGKLLGYMNHSKPILGSVNPDNDLKSIIENADAGMVTINGDDESFLNNARMLLHDEALRIKTGENGNKLLKTTFSVEAASARIHDFYKNYKDNQLKKNYIIN